MIPMPRPLPPFVNRHRSRHGRISYYFRCRHGKRIRLPDIDDPGFGDAYAAALAGIQAAPTRPHTHPAAKAGTLAWLVAMWKGSSAWAATAPATRRQRDNILTHVLARAGGASYLAITARTIRQGREDRMTAPAAANNFLKTMRALFRWAKEAGLVETDPAREVTFIPNRTDGFMPWTAADVENYRAKWPIGTRERLAFEVLYQTGLRRGDAVRLGRQHVRDGIATLRAEKTGAVLHVPIAAELTEAIAAGPAGDMAFIATMAGRPMTKESFGNLFRRWCAAADVKASAHGLRKLAAADLAEAGGSEKELQAAFGWRTNAQSAVYTRTAENRRLAIQAARKRAGNKTAHTFAPEPPTPEKKGTKSDG